MTEEPKNQDKSGVALQALREYAHALRGDWSDFDGRSNKAALEEFADAIEGKGHAADWDIKRWRDDNGICPTEGTHWTRHCDLERCGNPEGRW